MSGEQLEKFIAQRVGEVLQRHRGGDAPDSEGWVQTDNLGEVLEKLIILHIRIWMLDDKVATVYEDDAQVADLKRKQDICVKQKRPMLVQAVNRLVDAAITDGRSLVDDSVKLYESPEGS